MSNFSPSPSSTVQRPDISMLLSEHDYARLVNSMIAYDVLPIQEVAEFSGNYGRLKAVEAAQDADRTLKRAAGGTYQSFDFKIDQDNYETEEYGNKVNLDSRFMNSYKYLAGGDMDTFRVIAAGIGQELLMLAQEKRTADAVFNATTFTSNTTAVGTEWSSASTATPTTDVKDAKDEIRQVFGGVDDSEFAVILSSKVRDNLRVCDDVTDKLVNVRPTNQLDITDADIARALGVGRIIVANAMKPTHAQGASAAAFDWVWDDEYAMVAKLSTPGPGGVVRGGLGRTFHWSEDGSIPMGLVETYFSDDTRCEIVRIRHQTDELIEIVPAGHLLSNITA